MNTVRKYRLLGTGYLRELDTGVEPDFTGIELYADSEVRDDGKFTGRALYFNHRYVTFPKIINYSSFRYTYLNGIGLRSNEFCIMNVYKHGQMLTRIILPPDDKIINLVAYYILATVDYVDYYTQFMDYAALVMYTPVFTIDDYWNKILTPVDYLSMSPAEQYRTFYEDDSVYQMFSESRRTYIIGNNKNKYKCTYFSYFPDIRNGHTFYTHMYSYMDAGYLYVTESKLRDNSNYVHIGLIKYEDRVLKLITAGVDDYDVIAENKIVGLGKSDFIDINTKERYISVLNRVPGEIITT